MEKYDEDKIIASLREYNHEKKQKAYLATMFNEVRLVCEAAHEAGFDDNFVGALGMELVLSSLASVAAKKKPR